MIARTTINGIAVIYQGDTTSSGGTVLEGSAHYVENDNKLALKGHAVFCPVCETTGTIAEGSYGLTVHDIPAALHGHHVDCGCPPGSVTLVAHMPAAKPVSFNQEPTEKELERIFDCTHCLQQQQGQLISSAALTMVGAGHGITYAGSVATQVGTSLTFAEILLGLVRFTPLVILIVPGDTPVKPTQISYSDSELRTMALFKRSAKVSLRYAINRNAAGQLSATGYRVDNSLQSFVPLVMVVEQVVAGQRRFVVELPDLPPFYWTPDGSQLPELPTTLPTPQSDEANKISIFINPLPEPDAQGASLHGLPLPDQPTFNDFILVFPADSGVKPFYIALADKATNLAGKESISHSATDELTGITQKQLDKKFKHAVDFGVTATQKNSETLYQYETAIKNHMGDMATKSQGTYGFVKDSKVFFNSKTNNVVVLDSSGNFVTGFKLTPETPQYDNYIKKGVLR